MGETIDSFYCGEHGVTHYSQVCGKRETGECKPLGHDLTLPTMTTKPEDALVELQHRLRRTELRYTGASNIMTGDKDIDLKPETMLVNPDGPAAADAITTLLERERLRPVETAPKDGSYFLFVGTNFDGGMAVVCWDEGLDWWTLDDGKNPEIMLRHESGLTGWLPLPEARAALTGMDK